MKKKRKQKILRRLHCFQKIKQNFGNKNLKMFKNKYFDENASFTFDFNTNLLFLIDKFKRMLFWII